MCGKAEKERWRWMEVLRGNKKEVDGKGEGFALSVFTCHRRLSA